MTKVDFFYLKNKGVSRKAAWGGAFFVAYLGWILGGIGAAGLGLKLGNWELAKLTLIFPLLAIVPLILNYIFKFHTYFLPNIMVTTISIYLSMTLAILFNLVSLYYILPYLIWLAVAVAVAVVHYLVWHFNQLKAKPLARRVMKAYKEGVLGKMNVIDPNKYLVSSPAWLSMAGNTMIFIAVIMSGVAFISNKLDSTQTWILPAVSFAALTISFALQAFFVRPCGYIKPTIEVIRILQEEDDLADNQPD